MKRNRVARIVVCKVTPRANRNASATPWLTNQFDRCNLMDSDPLLKTGTACPGRAETDISRYVCETDFSR